MVLALHLRQTQQLLWDELRLAVELTGAAALEALLSDVYQPGPEEKVGAVLCGANVDLATLTEERR